MSRNHMLSSPGFRDSVFWMTSWPKRIPIIAEEPVLSITKGPVLSNTEGPVLSITEGPVLSITEGPLLHLNHRSAYVHSSGDIVKPSGESRF